MQKPRNYLPETEKEITPLVKRLTDVWEPLHAEPGQILWHYTTADGLKGILESCKQELWKVVPLKDGKFKFEPILGSCMLRATNVFYMNDTREVTYAREIMLEEIYFRKGKYPDPADEFLERVEIGLRFGEMISQPHIACFCDDEAGDDLLSQWRGYASTGGGYALGFRSASLASHGPKTPLRKVIYDETMQRKLIGDTLDDFWMALSVVAPSFSSSTAKLGLAIGDFADAIAPFLDEYVACFKHPKFEVEKEWRLIQRVVPFKTADPKLVTVKHAEFRVARGMLVPYVEFDVGEQDPNDRLWRLPLEQITIGPTRHPMQAENSLKQILNKHDYENGHSVKIKLSEIPLLV
jgi:hypothetical protein